MKSASATLADRLGLAAHVSPLRYKVERLAAEYSSATASCVEHWLLDVANQRGARIVCRPRPPESFTPPREEILSNAELITALCQLQCLDEPQILRLAAQLISRGSFDLTALRRLARQERIEPVLAALARLALHVDPTNRNWQAIGKLFGDEAELKEPLLHWSRLAQPVLKGGRYNAAEWVLVA